MGNYMRALQQRFDTQRSKELDTLHQEFNAALDELRSGLERSERKLLLRIIDTAAALRDEQSLVSFAAGYKLAHGIAEELRPRYSFAKEDEQRACAKMENEREED